MIEILNRYTRAVQYRDEQAASVAEAVRRAYLSGADLPHGMRIMHVSFAQSEEWHQIGRES